MIRHKLAPLLIWAFLTVSVAQTAQAGVMPEKTRLIFDEGQSQRSLMLANTNAYPVVVQTWVDNGEGNQAPENTVSTMVALPSVFRLQPGALQGLRIVYDGSSLPKDRESVSWLNIYEIPPAKASAPLIATQVAVAMNTQMKVFYRPANLPSTPEQMAATLTFSLKQQSDGWVLICHNPTPYHASFSSLRLVAQGHDQPVAKTPDMMTPPLSDKAYSLEAFHLGGSIGLAVNYTLIDDNGHYHDGSATVQAP
ncbi:P pilus assembly protein, chaperone PapD [Pseudomonas taetrolens]|uniref:Molecular chaperone n=2 Tax=Pseudomonas taetrolens TaxID=47884 RepID=A0A0J6GRC9_PSETA|nr:molecular chaperone [Pseudomonas taetrolens]SEC67661.1 P pilus assembly protein, chaperone PapD [Pseudomonas taetrolens]SQF87032.1 pili assembly chaperone [Pseudomonas taetrolens]VEH50110.1 pili assembly chaperone [Pseudomonas taetrolens]